MRICLDTNRYTDFARGDHSVREVLEQSDAVMIPTVVLGELRGGFRFGARAAENEADLRRLMAEDGISSLEADDQTSQHYATVYAQLRRQGTPIPTNDIWIAALALQHGLVLYSRDPHFAHVAQLPRI